MSDRLLCIALLTLIGCVAGVVLAAGIGRVL